MRFEFNLELHKIIAEMRNFVKFGVETNKRKLDKGVHLLEEVLFALALFLIAIFWAFGHFILGR